MVRAQGKPHMKVISPKKCVSHKAASTDPAGALGWQDAYTRTSWLDYFWSALLQAYKKFEERTRPFEGGRGAEGEGVCAKILKRHRSFSNSEIMDACPGINRDMKRLILRQNPGPNPAHTWLNHDRCRLSL